MLMIVVVIVTILVDLVLWCALACMSFAETIGPGPPGTSDSSGKSMDRLRASVQRVALQEQCFLAEGIIVSVSAVYFPLVCIRKDFIL